MIAMFVEKNTEIVKKTMLKRKTKGIILKIKKRLMQAINHIKSKTTKQSKPKEKSIEIVSKLKNAHKRKIRNIYQ